MNCSSSISNPNITEQKQKNTKSIPWVVRLTWLENADSRPPFSAVDFDR